MDSTHSNPQRNFAINVHQSRLLTPKASSVRETQLKRSGCRYD